jgi:hypothetical protein
MAVLTTDLLLEGVRRDEVFAWISVPANHGRILQGTFDGCAEQSEGTYVLTVTAGPRTRSLVWCFDRPDDSHGGRRVYIRTEGKRFQGVMSFSLRTMKPSTNTLVTLHYDFSPGGLLGSMAMAAGLEDALSAGMKQVVQNLKRELKADA